MRHELSIDKRLAIALDTDDQGQALEWAKAVRGIFGVAKVGLQLFSAQGPTIVGQLRQLGFEVFLDLKLHDIPTTVEKAARVIGSLGVTYATVHAVGGVEMVKAALSGLREGAESAGHPQPQLLGVTVLTSVQGASSDELTKRIAILMEARSDGLVCAPTDLALVHSKVPNFVKVVPGIRRPQDPLEDQARVSGPEVAVAAGADVLVIGRPVTAATDCRQAAQEMRSLVEIATK
jgi:orotidine-5'-phosphate decarboxylase